MRICIFTDSIDKSKGGPSRSVPILAKGLAMAGCDVTLMTLESDDMNLHILEDSRVKTIVLPSDCSTRYLESCVLNEKFDLIHSQGIWLPIYHKLSKVANRNHIKYLTMPRGDLEPWSLSQKALKKKIALALYQRSDINKACCIVATAEMEKDHLRGLGFNNPIAVIPNGIDVSEYKCRDISSLSTIKKQILFLSRIHPKKGIEVLIDTWEHLKDDYPDWRIIVAGNGEKEYIESLKEIIKLKSLDDCISIIPPVFGSKKYELYKESSLFVLPTYSENFGMVIAEAMSCGLPVVTTTGTPWLELNKEELGWCVDLSIENVERALRDALSLSVEELFSKGQKCSEYVNDKFNYISVANQTLQLYHWLKEGGETPSFLAVL